jgi:hypothetical protein
MASSQQSGIEYTNPKLVPICAALFEKSWLVWFDRYFYVHSLDEHQTDAYNIFGDKAFLTESHADRNENDASDNYSVYAVA